MKNVTQLRRVKHRIGSQRARQSGNAVRQAGRPVVEMLEQRTMLSISTASWSAPLLMAGTTYTYQETSSDPSVTNVLTIVQTVKGPTTLNGQPVIRVDGTLSNSDGSGTGTGGFYLGTDSNNNVVLYSSMLAIPGATTADVFTPYETIGPATLTAGVTQTFTNTDVFTITTSSGTSSRTDSETYSYTLQSETPTSLTVPSGTYQAYIVVVEDTTLTTASTRSFEVGSTSDTITTEWFVPGVGNVKSLVNDLTNVLTSFNNSAEHLAFTQPPVDTAKGDAIAPVKISVLDSSGNVDTTATGSITVALHKISGSGSLTGTLTEPLVAGVATFSDLKVDAGGTYTLTATDDATPQVTSAAPATFKIAANKLIFLAQPGNASLNALIPLTVQLVDKAGVPVTDAVGTVVLSLNTVAGGTNAVLSGVLSAPLVNGVATFTSTAGPKINVVGAYTFTATEEDTSTGVLAPTQGTATAKSARFQVGAAVTVESVTTADSKNLSIIYKVAANPTDAPFPIYVYRSSNATYSVNDTAAVPVAILNITAGDAVEGTHSITVSAFGTAGVSYLFSQAQAFRPDPTHKYLIVTADQSGTLAADDATTIPQSGFRFWLIGSVTHGYVGSIPAVLNSEIPTDFAGDYQSFVDSFAKGLIADGYDAAVRFHWEYEADKAVPMQPVQQGVKLEQEILDRERTLGVGLNDVVDLNLIGWSRGTIVVNSALTTLNADPNTPADIKRGFICETLVDPHPANNGISQASEASLHFYSDNITIAKNTAVLHGYHAFQTAVHDLEGVGFIIPPNVDAVSDMYQHNPIAKCYGSEAILNLWGITPSQITPNGRTSVIEHLVTTEGIGHSEIMVDTERHIIQGNQTLQQLNLFPFGSAAPSPSAVLPALNVKNAAGINTDHLVIDPLQTGLLSNQSFWVTVSAINAAGKLDANFTGNVTLSLASLSGGALTGTVTATAVGGVATFAGLTISKAGTHRISVSAAGLANGTTPWFTTTNTRLVVTSQPAGATTASPFGLTVSAKRADGSIDTSFAGTITLTAFTEPTDIQQTLGGITVRSAVAGTAVFSGLTVPSSGEYLVSISSPDSADGATDGFTVSGTYATKLVFANTPATTSAVTTGTPFALAILAEDAAGNLDASFNGPVTVAVSAGPGTLGGTAVVNAINGVASFSGLTLSTTGTGYTLTASGGGFTATATMTATAPGIATTLVASVPSGAMAGAAFTVTVSAADGFGTVDPTFSGAITLSASLLGVSGVVLGGTLTVNAVAGVATFSGISISTAGSGYSFTATSSLLSSAVPSGPLSIAPGTGTRLKPTFDNSVPVPNVPFTTYVRALDAYGNLATDFSGLVTISSSDPNLGGTLTSGAVNGIAVFYDLTLPATSSNTTLTASSSAVQSGMTSIPAISTDELVVTSGAIGNTAVNSPFGLKVSAVTPAGIVDTSFASPVTIAFTTTVGSTATLGGTLTAAPINGVATFDGLSVNTVGIYSISVTSASAGGVTTTPFTVTVGPLVLPGPLASNTFYVRKDTDGVNLDVWQNSATPGSGLPTQKVLFAGLSTLSITGNAGNDSLTLDFSNGNPFPTSVPVSFDGLGGVNSLTIVGTTGDDTLTAGLSMLSFASSAFVGSIPINITKLQSIQFHGGGGGSDRINVTGGSFNIDADTTTGTPNVSVTVQSAGIATFNSDQHLANLTINGGTALFGAAAHYNMNVKGLSITGNGLFDITNSYLYVDNTVTPFATIKQYMDAGYNLHGATNPNGPFHAGDYNGRGGITSSLAKASYTVGDLIIGVGYYDGSLQNANNPDSVGQILGPNSNSGHGTGILNSQILIRPTLTGDLNGDGVVNSYDVNLFNSYGLFNNGPTSLGWQAGDLNGDGVVDSKDVTIYNTVGNFNTGSFPSIALASVTPSIATAPNLSVAVAASQPVSDASAKSTYDVNAPLVIPTIARSGTVLTANQIPATPSTSPFSNALLSKSKSQVMPNSQEPGKKSCAAQLRSAANSPASQYANIQKLTRPPITLATDDSNPLLDTRNRPSIFGTTKILRFKKTH